MNRLFLVLLFIPLWAWSEPSADPLKQKIDTIQSKVSKAEASHRQLIDQISGLNRRIQQMATQRAKINEKMLDSEGDAQQLAFEVRELEQLVREKRGKIGKYLGQIYQMQNPSVMTFLFSGQSAGEMEKNRKFLKLLSERDHKLFLTYQESLKKVKETRTALNNEVRRLLSLRKNLLDKENDLLGEQRIKAKLVQSVKRNKEENLQTLKTLRSKLPELDQKNEVAFFEKKGDLISPLPLAPVQTYGTQFDPIYRVKLLHMGWSYKGLIVQPVRAVFEGKVKYAGLLPGYGISVVIDHGDHYYTIYTNNSKALAFEGEQIFAGQMIAQSSGQMYFELRHFSNALDPAKWISLESKTKMAMNHQEAP